MMDDPFAKFTWAWTKYYYNSDTFIVIPKNADYIDMELLTASLSGLLISTNRDNSEIVKEN